MTFPQTEIFPDLARKTRKSKRLICCFQGALWDIVPLEGVSQNIVPFGLNNPASRSGLWRGTGRSFLFCLAQPELRAIVSLGTYPRLTRMGLFVAALWARIGCHPKIPESPDAR